MTWVTVPPEGTNDTGGVVWTITHVDTTATKPQKREPLCKTVQSLPEYVYNETCSAAELLHGKPIALRENKRLRFPEADILRRRINAAGNYEALAGWLRVSIEDVKQEWTLGVLDTRIRARVLADAVERGAVVIERTVTNRPPFSKHQVKRILDCLHRGRALDKGRPSMRGHLWDQCEEMLAHLQKQAT